MGEEFTSKLLTKAKIISLQRIMILEKQFDKQEEI